MRERLWLLCVKDRLLERLLSFYDVTRLGLIFSWSRIARKTLRTSVFAVGKFSTQVVDIILLKIPQYGILLLRRGDESHFCFRLDIRM